MNSEWGVYITPMKHSNAFREAYRSATEAVDLA